MTDARQDFGELAIDGHEGSRLAGPLRLTMDIDAEGNLAVAAESPENGARWEKSFQTLSDALRAEPAQVDVRIWRPGHCQFITRATTAGESTTVTYSERIMAESIQELVEQNGKKAEELYAPLGAGEGAGRATQGADDQSAVHLDVVDETSESLKGFLAGLSTLAEKIASTRDQTTSTIESLDEVASSTAESLSSSFAEIKSHIEEAASSSDIEQGVNGGAARGDRWISERDRLGGGLAHRCCEGDADGLE